MNAPLPVLSVALLLLGGCAQSALLDIERSGQRTAARNTGTFPDFRRTPRRATRQFTPGQVAAQRADLSRAAARAAARPPVDGAAADARARRLLAEAEAEERRRRRRIRTEGRVGPG